jgi:hypothetical protein
MGQYMAHEKLVETFEKATLRLKFHYLECQNLDSKAKVEKIWPLCYGKAKMPYCMIITKEFALGIVVESKLDKAVNRATFVKETNTN